MASQATIEEMLREVLTLDPVFPDGRRSYVDQIQWEQRFLDWKQGKNLDSGRDALRNVLANLRDSGPTER